MSNNPFEQYLKSIQYSNMDFHGALIDVNDSVDFAKKILLNNRVQNFMAADVVRVAEVIISRADMLRQRRMEADHWDGLPNGDDDN